MVFLNRKEIDLPWTKNSFPQYWYDCSALKKQVQRTPPVAAKRGPQFGGGSNRQNRQFGQDDLIGGGGGDDENGTAEYNFAYEVNSDEGAQYSHQENAEAGVISGEYRVNLPDGRVQIVR